MRLSAVARRWSRVLFAGALALSTACKGLGDITAPRPVETPVAVVEFSSNTVTLSEGASVALVITARDAENRPLAGRTVAWSSSDPTIASVSNVGLVTALRPGIVQIAASVDGRSATVQLTITTRAVASVQVTPTTPTLLKGGTVQLTATTLDELGNPLTGRTVFWGTSDPLIAVVDVSGLVTGIAPGVATVTATSESRTAAVGVTVSPVPVSSVQISPLRDTVVVGQATQLTATPRDSSGASLDDLVAFSSSAAGVATVSSSGVVLGVAPGTATITATAGGRSSNAVIVVLPRPVGAVIVSPAQSALTVGQTVALTVQITDGSGNLLTGRPVSFQSSNVNVAQVSAGGVVSATAPGTATITVTSEGNVGTATVSVTPSPIVSLRVDPASASLRIGGVLRLSAAALDAGGNPISQRVITWTSGAPSVVTVNSEGVVTAIGSGTALVFAAAEGRLASATITVAPNSPSTVSVQPILATVIVGQSQDLAATLRDGEGREITGRAIVWTSSSPAVAIVSNTGRVRAVAPGVTRIDATVDGIVGSSTITVIPVPVATVAVNLAAASLIVGQTTQATAVARDSSGGALTGRIVAWSSTNTAVATVSQTGLVTAVSLGSVSIRGTVESVVGSATFSVVVGSPTTIAANSAVTQTATAGTAVAAPPSVRVTDAGGTPVLGVSVTFAVTGGGGSVTPATVATNASGVATLTSWTLGGTVGVNTVTAAVSGLTGSPVTFTATGTVGAAATIAATSVTTQSTTAGTAVSAPPSVRVADAFGNPVAGVAVTFAVTAGGGVINATTVNTSALGVAALTSWTLGATAGVNTVTATAAGLTGSPVAFSATGTVGAAANIIAASVVSQSATVGTAVGAPPSIRVRDAVGNGVSGVAVTFTLTSGGGSIAPASPATVISNASGLATLTSWTLGSLAGANTITATATGLSGSPVVFSATGIAGSATAIAANSVLTQSATAGTAVTTPPSVLVTDVGGNPVAGVIVNFAAATGGGSVSPASIATSATGIATLTTWTLGAAAGANTVTATVAGLSGSPVTFSATGVAGAATQLAVVTQPAGATSGTPFTTQPVVELRDVNGNRTTSTATITVAQVAGAGVLSGTTSVAAIAGRATFSGLTITGVGAHTLQFASTTPAATVNSASFTVVAGAPTAIAATSVTTQSATAGTTVATPPSVRVNDAGNNPVSGVTVTFAVTGGGGSISPSSVVTNASGIATLTSWTLGAVAGANSVSATVAGLTGSPVAFSATGTVGAATAIVTASTTPQTAAINTAVPSPPSARVNDAFGNGVPGVSVTFTVTAGGGTLNPASPAVVVTNASGVATVTSWTLGSAVGANTVTAAAAGLTGSPVSFNATATTGAATTITNNSTLTQSANAGTSVATPPSVLVRDAGNNPVSGVTVTFAVTGGGGSVSPATVATNASGIATLTSWTLGAVAGANSVSATVAGLTGSPVAFTATGNVGPAAAIVTASTTPQSAAINTAVAAPPSARVNDAFGNGVAGVSVTFTVTAGGGTLNPASPAVVVTNASGVATVTSWTLGATAGANTVTAAATGLTNSPVSFNATATAGAATTIAAISTTTQSANAGTNVTTPPSVRVSDAGNNPVSGVTVTFAVTSGGGSVAPATVNTDALGIATLTSWTLGATAGANSVSATVAGLTGSPVAFSATGTVGPAAAIVTASTTPQSAGINTAVASPPSARVNDAFGNGVAGVNVTFTVTAGGGTLNPASPAVVATNASGVATVTSWTLGATAGANTVTASAAGLTNSPLSFNATATAGAATTITNNSTLTQSANAGTSVATPPSVLVRDAGNNPVSGVTVTFAVTGGGGSVSPASVITDALGIATLTSWTLGAVAGANSVSATVAGLTGSPVAFTATGNVGPAAAIVTASTTPQSAAINTAVASPPSARVNDAFGNGVAGVNVTFTVTAGGGALDPASPAVVATDVNGVATVTSWTLGATAGANTVTAAAAGLTGSPVSFNATATAGAATTIANNSTLTQSANAGTNVSTPPSVRVSDAGNNPVSGVTVTFAVTSGGGSVAPATVNTDALGIATLTSWTLGATAGANSVSATVAGLTGSPVAFSATGTVGPAAAIVTASTTPQSAGINTAVASPPSARVNDAFGNGVAGVNVTFTVTAGGGTLDPASPAVVATNASGIATVTSWTLGAAVGANTVTAAAAGLTGSPVSFNATATAGPATTITNNSTTSQSANAGTTVGTPPSVLVRDAGNNPVSGVTVTFAVTGGGGSVSPASVITDALGIATLTSWTLGATAGANTVSATVAGLAGSPVAFSATGTVGPAAAIVTASTTPQTAAINTAVGSPPSARVNDAFGNGVAGVNVTFTVTAGGGTLDPASPAVVATDVNGVATVTSWTLGATAGANTVTAAAAGLTGSPVSFNATATAGAATTIANNSTLAQSANAGTNVSTPPSVRVSDAGNNPVSGVTVTFAVTSGGGSVAPASVDTDALGIATLTSWTLGTTAGANTVSATVAGLTGSPVAFSATGTVGPAAAITANSTPPATATVNSSVTAPSVRVADAFGNGVSGVNVTFTLTAGDGSISPASPTVVPTDAAGVASLSSWTLGQTAGVNTVSAAAPGLTGTPVTFSTTGTAGAAANLLALSVLSQDATVNTAVAAPPSVRVTDAFGNVVSGVSVTFTVTGGGGSSVPISPGVVLTNASGVATLTSWTVGTTAGANTLSAAAAGLTGSPVEFSATGLAAAPTDLVITTQPAGAADGVAFTTQPVVELRDTFGNRTSSNATVTVAKLSGDGTLSGTLTVDAVNGVATFAGLLITGGNGGAHTLRFTTTTPALTVDSGSFVVTP